MEEKRRRGENDSSLNRVGIDRVKRRGKCVLPRGEVRGGEDAGGARRRETQNHTKVQNYADFACTCSTLISLMRKFEIIPKCQEQCEHKNLL